MSIQEPGWVGFFSATYENGRWVIPFGNKHGAEKAAERLQAQHGVKLRIEKVRDGYDVVEDK